MNLAVRLWRAPTGRPPRSAVLAGLTLAVVLIALLSLGTGAMAIPTDQVARALLATAGLDVAVDPQAAAILGAIRLPRVVLGLLAGAALAGAGAVTQGVFRNPLAEPTVIGVSAGASLGATTMIVLAPTGLAASLGIPGAAFLGAWATAWLVYRLGVVDGRVSVVTLLLAGIAVNAVSFAGVGLLYTIATEAQLRSITMWTLGSVGAVDLDGLLWALPGFVLPLWILRGVASELDLLTLGERDAAHLGLDVARTQRKALFGVALLTGTTISLTGQIGFVGLVVPHLLRLAFGPGHKLLLPASALLGAGLLVGADTLARTVVAPSELPVGVLTALVGGPFFLFLLLGQRRSLP